MVTLSMEVAVESSMLPVASVVTLVLNWKVVASDCALKMDLGPVKKQHVSVSMSNQFYNFEIFKITYANAYIMYI